MTAQSTGKGRASPTLLRGCPSWDVLLQGKQGMAGRRWVSGSHYTRDCGKSGDRFPRDAKSEGRDVYYQTPEGL